jgi:hypothetical protein
MSTNPFDQFDTQTKQSANPFDQFEKPKEKSTGQKIFEYAEPVVETAGAIGGSIAGSALGPVGTAAGAGLGYGGAKAGMRGLGQYFGYEKPQSLKESAVESAKDVATGAALEAGTTGALRLGEMGIDSIKKLANYYKTSKGYIPEELSNLLKTKLSGKLENIIGTAEKAKQAPEQEVSKIAKAQTELGGREPIATQRQTRREQRVKESLQDLSKKDNVLAEDVGGIIQPAGQTNVKALKKLREDEAIAKQKNPAFNEARTRESGGDFMSTNPKSAKTIQEIKEEVNAQIQRTPAPYQAELQRRYQAFLSDKPLTLDNAEFFRRLFKNKDMSKVENFEALDAARMNVLGDKIGQAMRQYDSRVGQYLDKYKEGSQAITKALAGRGKALTEQELAQEENVLFSADKKAAANYYLDGSQQRAERLLDLVGGKKNEIVDGIKGYFKNELSSANAKQTKDFINKHEGFLRVFPELKKPLDNVLKAKVDAETLGVRATEKAKSATTRLTGKATQASEQVAKQQARIDKYEKSLNKLSVDVNHSKVIADQLLDDKLITPEQHKAIYQQVQMIKNAYGDTAQAKEAMKSIFTKTLVGVGVPAGAVTVYKKFGE